MTIRFDRMDITVSERDDPEIFVTLVQEVAVPVTVDIRAVSGTAVERQGQYCCPGWLITILLVIVG